MKTIKLLLTTIAMLLCSVMANAHDFEVDGIFYDILSYTDLTVKVTYNASSYKEYSGVVTIPSSVTYEDKTYSVTSIGYVAFGDCTSLTSITIPNSVTSIEGYAFSGCSSLTSVTIPNSVTIIGDDAFYECSNLQSLTIGVGVLSIGSQKSTPAKVIWLPNTPPSGYKNLAGKINYIPNNQYSLTNAYVYPFLSSMFETDGAKYIPISPSERTCDVIDCIYDS